MLYQGSNIVAITKYLNVSTYIHILEGIFNILILAYFAKFVVLNL